MVPYHGRTVCGPLAAAAARRALEGALLGAALHEGLAVLVLETTVLHVELGLQLGVAQRRLLFIQRAKPPVLLGGLVGVPLRARRRTRRLLLASARRPPPRLKLGKLAL